jgi:hypothetical protein
VALATTVGVTIVFVAVTLLGGGGSLGDPSNSGSIGNVIQYLLLGVLVSLAVKSYLRCETVEPPRWLGTLQRADARRAFSIGFLVILLMPSHVVIQLLKPNTARPPPQGPEDGGAQNGPPYNLWFALSAIGVGLGARSRTGGRQRRC